MAEAFKACRAASQSISVASNGGRGSQEAADACSPRRWAIRRRHSAVDEGRGGRVVARHIQPQYAEEVQTFSVELYDPQIRKLDQPVDLESFLETIGTDGQRMPTFEEREANQPTQNVMLGWLNNVLVMTCTAMTTVLIIVILVLLAKHFKMKVLVSMLAISSLPPPAEAANFTTVAIASALIAPNPAIGTKVVCAYPVAVIWQNVLGYLVLACAIAQYFRLITWCKG